MTTYSFISPAKQIDSRRDKVMKCPLFRLANITFEFDSQWSGDDCLQRECAWFDIIGQTCALLSIYQELRLLVGACGMIADNMPHVGR